MKRFMIVLCVALLSMVGMVDAAVTTVTFDAASMMAPATQNLGNPAAGDGAIQLTSGTYLRNYVDGGTPAFNAWLGSMDSAGKGISEFNLWLQGDITAQASWWGENLSITDFTKPITAIGPTGWTASVIPAPLDWGPSFAGRELIVFSTTNPDDYIRQGYDGVFQFTADTNGVVGGSYTIWVGAGDAGDSSGAANSIHDPSNDAAIAFQRAITADVVPEPATMIIWSLLGAGSWLGMRVWRRRGPGFGDDMAGPARQTWSPESRQAIHEMIARGSRSRS